MDNRTRQEIAQLRDLIGGGGGGAGLSNATPAAVGTAAAGIDTEASRSDHVHAHGNQLGGALHAAATTLAAGFLEEADKIKLDAVPFISVKDPAYNAGVGGDDAAKILAALTAANAAGIGRVHMPEGTYVLDCQSIADATTLVALVAFPGDNMMLTGDGPGRTIINVTNATSAPAGYGVNCFGATSLSNIVFDGLHFVGENNPFTYVFNNSGSCIRTFLSDSVTIRNCRFESLWGFSAHSDGCVRTRVEDCSFEDTANGLNINSDYHTESRLVMKQCEGSESASSYSTYSDIIIENAQGVGMSLGGDQGAERPGCVVSNIVINGCTGGNGMVLNDGFCFASVSNVLIRHCEQSGLVVYQSGNPGAPVTRNIKFSNVTVDTNCVYPNIGSVVGAAVSGAGGHDFFNCSFTDDADPAFRQVQGLSLNAPDCSVSDCRMQGHTATPANKDASFGPLCTNLKLGLNNRFENNTQEFQAGCTIDANTVLGIAATDRVLEFMVWNDSPGAGRRRHSLQLDGKMTWGDGLNLEDTNLYRSAADALKTDDAFIASSLTTGGAVAATGTVTGSNLSGTHSGTSSGTNTGDQVAGTGLTGTTTLNVIANADGSIVANANDIQVGVINDTQHGARAGGTTHADVVAGSPGTSGFMTGAQATKLAGVATGATAEVDAAAGVAGRINTSAQTLGTGTKTVDDLIATNTIKTAVYKTAAATIASAGVFRMAKTDDIAWRNNANSANNLLSTTADEPTWNGVVIPTISSTSTFTNKTLTAPAISGTVMSGTWSGTPTFSGLLTLSAGATFSAANTYKGQTSITAHAGGGQGSAQAVTGEVVYVTVCATNLDSVKLPTAALGAHCVIFNLGAASCDVFPVSGSTIDALAANAAYNIAAGGSREFWGQSATQWRSK